MTSWIRGIHLHRKRTNGKSDIYLYSDPGKCGRWRLPKTDDAVYMWPALCSTLFGDYQKIPSDFIYQTSSKIPKLGFYTGGETLVGRSNRPLVVDYILRLQLKSTSFSPDDIPEETIGKSIVLLANCIEQAVLEQIFMLNSIRTSGLILQSSAMVDGKVFKIYIRLFYPFIRLPWHNEERMAQLESRIQDLAIKDGVLDVFELQNAATIKQTVRLPEFLHFLGYPVLLEGHEFMLFPRYFLPDDEKEAVDAEVSKPYDVDELFERFDMDLAAERFPVTDHLHMTMFPNLFKQYERFPEYAFWFPMVISTRYAASPDEETVSSSMTSSLSSDGSVTSAASMFSSASRTERVTIENIATLSSMPLMVQYKPHHNESASAPRVMTPAQKRQMEKEEEEKARKATRSKRVDPKEARRERLRAQMGAGLPKSLQDVMEKPLHKDENPDVYQVHPFQVPNLSGVPDRSETGTMRVMSYSQDNMPYHRVITNATDTNLMPPDSYELIQRFVHMLSHDRILSDSDMWDLVSSMHTTMGGNEQGIELMNEYVSGSRYDHLYPPDKIEEMWEKQKYNTLPKTYRTLCYMAREDSYDEYKAWHDTWVLEKIMEVKDEASANHLNLASIFYRQNWLDFICTVDEKNRPIWYVFRNNTWSKLNTIKKVYILFYEMLIKVVSAEWNALYVKRTEMAEIFEELSPEEEEKFNNLENFLVSVTKNMGMRGFVDGIVSFLVGMFECKDFISNANQNPALKGCKNGVIHCTEKQALFRQGRPEDYVTEQMNVIYDDSLSLDHPDVRFILDFFHKVWCDPELEHYMRKDFASFLLSGNREKILRFYIGTKAFNGKSTICTALSEVMGQYSSQITEAFLTKEQHNPESATPLLATVVKSAIAICNEPDAKARMRIGKIKELTGGADYITYRRLNTGQERSPVLCKVIVNTNHATRLDYDKGIKARTFYHPFDSQFLEEDECPKTEAEQFAARTFPKDPDFLSKLRERYHAWLWLMVHDFKAYREEGLVPKDVEAIAKSTRGVWEEENAISIFLRDTIQRKWVDAEGNSVEAPEIDENETPEQEKERLRIMDTLKPDPQYYITGSNLYDMYTEWIAMVYTRTKSASEAQDMKSFQEACIDILRMIPQSRKGSRTVKWIGLVRRDVSEE